MAIRSQQVHGSEHKCTIRANALVEICKLVEICNGRRIIAMPEGNLFQALRYEKNGEICVSQALSRCQGRWMKRDYFMLLRDFFMLLVISYFLVKAVW